jgi:CheY-like chemotaxis protein
MDIQRGQPMPKKSEEAGRNSPQGCAPIRVLLAEDDPDIREALVAVLETEGCDVHALNNGSELLEHLGSWLLEEESEAPADVIITDVRMPGFNGLNIIDGLRAYGWPLPVVVISAFADDEMRQAVARMKSAAFMEKPIDIKRLKPTILRMIGR